HVPRDEGGRSRSRPKGLWRGRTILELSDPHYPSHWRLAPAPAPADRSQRHRSRHLVASGALYQHWGAMSRRKKSHQSHGTANRPRFWGKHAVAAALDNPNRKVLRAWATR